MSPPKLPEWWVDLAKYCTLPTLLGFVLIVGWTGRWAYDTLNRHDADIRELQTRTSEIERIPVISQNLRGGK